VKRKRDRQIGRRKEQAEVKRKRHLKRRKES
jgi:hypothetical protein